MGSRAEPQRSRTTTDDRRTPDGALCPMRTIARKQPRVTSAPRPAHHRCASGRGTTSAQTQRETRHSHDRLHAAPTPSTSDAPPSTTDTAKDEAGTLKDKAAGAGGHLLDEAKGEAAAVTQEARRQLGDLWSPGPHRGRPTRPARSRAGSPAGLTSVGGQLSQMAARTVRAEPRHRRRARGRPAGRRARPLARGPRARRGARRGAQLRPTPPGTFLLVAAGAGVVLGPPDARPQGRPAGRAADPGPAPAPTVAGPGAAARLRRRGRGAPALHRRARHRRCRAPAGGTSDDRAAGRPAAPVRRRPARRRHPRPVDAAAPGGRAGEGRGAPVREAGGQGRVDVRRCRRRRPLRPAVPVGRPVVGARRRDGLLGLVGGDRRRRSGRSSPPCSPHAAGPRPSGSPGCPRPPTPSRRSRTHCKATRRRTHEHRPGPDPRGHRAHARRAELGRRRSDRQGQPDPGRAAAGRQGPLRRPRTSRTASWAASPSGADRAGSGASVGAPASSVGDTAAGPAAPAGTRPAATRSRPAWSPSARGGSSRRCCPARRQEQQLAQSAKEQAAPLVQEAKDAAQGVAENLREPAQEAAAAVKDRAAEAGATLRDEGRVARPATCARTPTDAADNVRGAHASGATTASRTTRGGARRPADARTRPARHPSGDRRHDLSRHEQHPQHGEGRRARAGGPAQAGLPGRPHEALVEYVLRKTLREFTQDQCTDLAAALTYYAVLAIAPALLARRLDAGLVGDPASRWSTGCWTSSGTSASDAAVEHASSRSSTSSPRRRPPGFALIFGLLLALWSASGYVARVQPRHEPRLRDRRGPPDLEAAPGAARWSRSCLVVIAVLIVAAVVLSGRRRPRRSARPSGLERRDGDRLEHREVARDRRCSSSWRWRSSTTRRRTCGSRGSAGSASVRSSRIVVWVLASVGLRVLRRELRQLRQDLRLAGRRDRVPALALDHQPGAAVRRRAGRRARARTRAAGRHRGREDHPAPARDTRASEKKQAKQEEDERRGRALRQSRGKDPRHRRRTSSRTRRPHVPARAATDQRHRARRAGPGRSERPAGGARRSVRRDADDDAVPVPEHQLPRSARASPTATCCRASAPRRSATSS